MLLGLRAAVAAVCGDTAAARSLDARSSDVMDLPLRRRRRPVSVVRQCIIMMVSHMPGVFCNGG